MSGRKKETVVVPAEWGERDAGKRYVITEISAARAESWGWRMLLLLQNSGETIPPNIQGLGYVGVAILGINTFLRSRINPADLQPLLDEMMTCVQIARDPKRPDIVTDIVSDDDIEEVRTRLWLRSEVLRVHTDFSATEALSRLISAATLESNSSIT